jgi:hypothetical protein
MNSARVCVIALALALTTHIVAAQDLSRYRVYVLESSLESVVAASGARPADIKTLHERPANIRELDWRAPYVSSGSELADPVSGVVFTFCNDSLYQVVVSYNRDRTDGLTNRDLIESLTVAYGEPVQRSARNRPPAALPDTVVLAQWDSKDSSLTLVRGAYASEYQLILMSKTLSARARNAIREAQRLDAIEAPRRELEQRQKEVADAAAVRDKIRTTNKAAFRP